MKQLIIRLVILLVLISGCGEDENTTPITDTKTPIPYPEAECVTSTGGFPQFIPLPPTGDNGSYDPTAAGDPTTGRVWMVFSRVDGRGGEGMVSNHLGFSDDGGSCWCYLTEINRSEIVPLSELPSEYEGAVSAHWSHEVPSLAYFPEAPAERRWVMTWHRYLHVDDGIPGEDDREFAYGWIGTRTASHPSELADAPEQKLFSALGYYKSVETESYNDQFIGKPQVKINDLSSELSTPLVLSEPGMQAVNGFLYVSMVAAHPTLGNDVIMVKMDPSGNWSYVSTLLTPQDAAFLNPLWTNFSATDLFIQNGQGYLLVSPVDGIYEGVLMFKLDFNSGNLTGAPDVFFELPKSDIPGIIQTGVATFDPLLINSGIIYGDAVETEPQFRLYATGVIPE